MFPEICVGPISKNKGYSLWNFYPVEDLMRLGVPLSVIDRLLTLSTQYAVPELFMGPLCVTLSNPTHQLTDPTQPNPLQVEKFGPNPIQVTMELTV